MTFLIGNQLIFFDASKCLVFADATGLSNSSDFVPCDENIQAVPVDNIELNNIDTIAGSSSNSFSSQIPTTSKDNSTSNKTPENADIFDTSKKPSKKRSHCLAVLYPDFYGIFMGSASINSKKSQFLLKIKTQSRQNFFEYSHQVSAKNYSIFPFC